MQTKSRLTRFFLILAVGAVWPFLSALLIMPVARHVRGAPYWYFGVWISNPILSIPNILPWLVLAIISTLRDRLGFAFWCAAVPIGGLVFCCFAYFQTATDDGLEGLWLVIIPILATVIAVPGACVGAVIQRVLARRSPRKKKGVRKHFPGDLYYKNDS